MDLSGPLAAPYHRASPPLVPSYLPSPCPTPQRTARRPVTAGYVLGRAVAHLVYSASDRLGAVGEAARAGS